MSASIIHECQITRGSAKESKSYTLVQVVVAGTNNYRPEGTSLREQNGGEGSLFNPTHADRRRGKVWRR